MNPKVSVIVPNYNHAPYLKQRIDSILNQTYQDFELILLDDCSTDNSRDVLESYRSNPHVTHVVFNEQNSGTPFSQWNKGVAMASGEWVWIAESDDWADLDFLETMIQTAQMNPECGVIFTQARYMRNGKIVWAPECDGKTNVYSGRDFVCDHLLYANVIYNVSLMVFRRKLYENVQPETFMHMRLCGDWMCYSQLCRNTQVAQINELHSYYRLHSSNTSSTAEHEGRTFLEGLDVIDYIVNKYQISPIRYSRYWGRELNKYQWKYDFTKETTNAILARLWKTHPLMAFYYYIYKLHLLCRK